MVDGGLGMRGMAVPVTDLQKMRKTMMYSQGFTVDKRVGIRYKMTT